MQNISVGNTTKLHISKPTKTPPNNIATEIKNHVHCSKFLIHMFIHHIETISHIKSYLASA